jgi:hypothetical protein
MGVADLMGPNRENALIGEMAGMALQATAHRTRRGTARDELADSKLTASTIVLTPQSPYKVHLKLLTSPIVFI